MHLKAIFTWLVSMFAVCSLHAQRPFEGFFTNAGAEMKCQLNLYESNIPIPGLELDSCYGYIDGKINGVWVILKVYEVGETKALARAISDKGADAQDIELEWVGAPAEEATDAAQKDVAGTLVLRQVKGTNIKGVDGRKYVKLPKDIIFERMKQTDAQPRRTVN